LPRRSKPRPASRRGKGNGQFESVPGDKSGLLIYGEQRAAAAADFNHDGRVDLAVTQNGATTKLFENAGATPGLRVRLNAGPSNPLAIGAALRLVSKNGKMGPLREIHAGSGYWSQDSAVQVICSFEPATAIWVRWPGGKVTTSALPAGVREIQIDQNGKVTAL